VSLHDQVAEEARALVALDLEGLRAEWRRRYGAAPALRSSDLLRHILAWKIQADRLGGLNASLKRALKGTGSSGTKIERLGEGALISREWQGRRYDVKATAQGYVYEGRQYRSLSPIAREITGARWNGPRFFGLRGGAHG